MHEQLNFHGFTLDVTNETLTRNGERVALQPQPMKVLTMLATRAGDLVTRKELQDGVWGSDTFVDFNQGLNWCIKRIREVLGDDASAPRVIETVPRKGYRFVARIDVPSSRGKRWPMIAAALALACFTMTHTDRASVTVVILPFDNFTGDARNELAANVATEEVINRVGSVDPLRLKVIDRLTAAKFRRTNECIIHIGRALGADFVMEGALQKSHATAALYRVADNTQVWATSVEHVDAAPAAISAKIASTFVQ